MKLLKSPLFYKKTSFNVFGIYFEQYAVTARLRHKIIPLQKRNETIYQTITNHIKINNRFGIYEGTNVIYHDLPASPSYLWFSKSIFHSEYEWYLQKSMVKDIFDIYQQFVKTIKKKTKTSFMLYGTLDKEREMYSQEMEYIGNTIMRKFVNYVYPTLLGKKEYNLLNGNHDSAIQKQERKDRQNNVVKIEKNVDIRREGSTLQNNTAIQNTIYNEINVEKIMDQMYRNIDEQLRYERLKKGY